ncbi:MAG: FAD-dependent oxidoreductase, partial [Micavibrio aeruginosavorus]
TIDGKMIFGGEDEEFSDAEKRDALIPKKMRKLEKKLKKVLPDYDFEIEHQWAGSFGSSTTGLPSIGRVPGFKNLYSVMAYGGNGITFSRIAAELITADITGYRHPDRDLFNFTDR